MKKTLILLLVIGFVSKIYAQDTASRDSSPHNRADIHNSAWALLTQVGVQQRMFGTLAISRNMFFGSGHGVYSYDFYVGYCVMPG